MRELIISILCLCSICAWAQSKEENFDFGWKFIEKDVTDAAQVSFDDKDWQVVNLPHDWNIHHAPSIDAKCGNDGGYYPGGTGWYRKVFKTPKAGRSVLHF